MAHEETILTDEAAARDGSSTRYIVQEIAMGRLKAEKRGRDWHIKVKDFEAWQKSKRTYNKAK